MTESRVHPDRTRPQRSGRLYLNGTAVGTVALRGHDGPWGFGEFEPFPEFSAFAAVFGRWSLLMHADGDEEPLSEAASDELRATEREMDAIRAKLLLETQEWRELSQINIDGPLIEWKEA